MRGTPFAESVSHGFKRLAMSAAAKEQCAAANQFIGGAAAGCGGMFYLSASFSSGRMLSWGVGAVSW